MKDIDQLIEQVHQAGRQRLERDCEQKLRPLPRPANRSNSLWRYAAILAAVALVAAGLLFPTRQEQPMYSNLPRTVKQQFDEVRHSSPLQQTPALETDLAYSESSEGVRVYCDNNCNADEVLARMETAIKSLI